MMALKKSLGQHFLMHARIAERIAKVARLERGEQTLEIGPGGGMLTRALLDGGARVVAVETDREWYEKLREEFANKIAAGKFELIAGDIRAFDPNSIEGEYSIVANIPYYLTGEIFRKFLGAKRQPRTMTLLVQKEVAERVARAKKESLLSLSVKAFGTPAYEFTVPRGAFLPAPKVDSAVISIRDISRKNFASPEEEARFFSCIRAGFAHKRKKLAGNLAGLVAPAALAALGLAPGARAEELPLAAWLALARAPQD
ncbi:MAG TPA: 16S rRNA (adenine(1518)-N(6)/adenine(1519)-N(6))-dimethyltransferase RsmA [Candidatus Paceibacterota bacterium]|nr:16S rRNA (adenine(1518)-N(6)/adenine(1519)-N(6))-dimethyltransferase RsmA [Candidatus Paceibacterota bacterium]